jgi:hypothetical protein
MRCPRLRCAVIDIAGVALMTRSFLRAIARGLVGAILTAQMTIAAYACPALSSPTAAHMQMPAANVSTPEPNDANVGVPMARMINCDDMAGTMDASSPNLCAEHCKYGQQSDHAPTLNAPTAVVIALYAIPPVLVMAPPPRPAADTMSALVAASPPHAILHCVHRI